MQRELLKAVAFLTAIVFAGPVLAQAVEANSQSGTADKGIASRPIANIAAGDIINGEPAVLGAGGNATVSQFGTWPSGIALTPGTGAVSTTVEVNAGHYSFAYQLCNIESPPACAVATDTVTVVVASIQPVAQSGTATAGFASTPIADVAANGTIDGKPAVLGTGGNAQVSIVGTWPAGFKLDTTTGAVTTAAAVAARTYSFEYALCDLNVPAECTAALVTVTVNSASVTAAVQTGSADAGIASRPIANIAAGGTIDGAAATLGTNRNATVAQVGTWATGIALNPGTGAVSTTVAVKAGTYSIAYSLCNLGAQPTCSNATDTVIVVTPSIVAASYSGTADVGVASQPIANLTVNDTINGQPATLGPFGNATIAKAGTWATGLGLNPTTGAVSTTSTLPVGSYTAQYILCDTNSPANCSSTGTVSVTVQNSAIVANSQAGSADVGVASRPITNIAATDTVHGVPVVLGAAGNATVTQVGTWPTGVALTPSTGAVSTTVAVKVGTYSIAYKLCDTNAPAACASATDSVNVITAAIVANPVAGNGPAGVATRVIANVAASDTIDGNAATLGSGGNATVAQSGTWPTGISLNVSTGAVTTTVSLTAGSYSFKYSLCDRNIPAVCATAPATVTITSPAVVANSQTGTATAGVASKPIANVAATDTINGAQATLGTSGNATIAEVGSWPTGITLNTKTGAITVAATVPAGTYDLQYQLCNKSASPICASAIDTIVVSASSTIALPIAGSSVVGTASTAIGNVTLKDSVYGAHVVLGSSGNATILPTGGWPTGMELNTETGAISTSGTVPTGNYRVAYQLCSRSTPAACASTLATVTVTERFAEQLASSSVVGNIAFDRGRDGVGRGNAQFAWTDHSRNLWVGSIDAATGRFITSSVNSTLVDSAARFSTDWSNGPEWALSTPVGSQQTASQLVFTRYATQGTKDPKSAVAAFATKADDGSWKVSVFAGTAGNGIAPEASRCSSDQTAHAVFENVATPTQVFTEALSESHTSPTVAPFDAYGNGNGEKWVACTSWLTLERSVGPGQRQVYWYDTQSQATQQLTFDSLSKSSAVMFRAPELRGQTYPYALIVLAGDSQIQIYRQKGVSGGAPTFELFNTIYSPDLTQPYIVNPRPFIHCASSCQTYIVMGLSRTAASSGQPNGLAVANIDPVNPLFKIVASAASETALQRLDPQYFITANGPYVYYDAVQTASGSKELGRYFIDMDLGAPAGACVGSSVDGGLQGPLDTCR